jgi:hypothetical protein
MPLKQWRAAASLIQANGGALENSAAVVVLMTAPVVVLGGLGLLAYALRGQQRMRELAMRERIALIERGLVPPPEVDPLRFEQSVSGQLGAEMRSKLRDLVVNRVEMAVSRRSSVRGTRYRSAGILLIGLGAALFLLIAFTSGSTDIGLGVGGAFVVLGVAVFLNGLLLAGESDGPETGGTIPRPPGGVPPSNHESTTPPDVGP